MEIQDLYKLFLTNGIICTDSRNITPGCLFFALKGENFNGNTFAFEAIQKGARLAIVDELPLMQHAQISKVNNVLETLQKLAAYHRQHTAITILAITGSNGKTTTKELCKAVLSKKFKVYATEGNLNNHIGVPLTLLSMDSSIEFGIVEMGANHPGEIDILCQVAQPDFGIITNIGRAHLEGFGGIEGVARAKGELFNHLMQHKKTIFLNEGDPYVCKLVSPDYRNVVYYNGKKGPEVINSKNDPFLELTIRSKDLLMDITTALVGGYNAENVLAAYRVGLHFGISAEEIKGAINAYQPRNNRSQLIDTKRNKIYMDAYNANPSSMMASIHEYLKIEHPKKMLILGEMLELGNSSQDEHNKLIAFLKKNGAGDVICIGEAFDKPAREAGYTYAKDVERLNEILSAKPVSGYFILIKGSRKNRLEKTVDLL
jgi:UDP-N-acetylmuramoyl-tripeptide--D-alanyl-D-alanine ligase